MGWLVNFGKTNPVRAMAIVNALIVLVVAFNLKLTNEQIAAITGLASLILGLGGELVRSQVTPVATLPEHVAASVVRASNADVPKVPVKEILPPADVSHLKPLFAFALVGLVFWAGCGTTGLSLKQRAVQSLQISESSLEGAQSIERTLCFNNPAAESGPVCTSPAAVQVGLTKLVADPNNPGQQIQLHQLISRYFVKAFESEIKAAQALLVWKAGDPAPATVAQYQADINLALLAAQQLIPGALSQPLVTKIQMAIDGAASIASAVGVK